MIPHNRKLFVILVHHGSREVTQTALDALYGGTVKPDVVFVVDHAREPFVSDTGHPVEVMRPTQNTGYAGGLLMGMGALSVRDVSPRDIVVCMNNDVRVGVDALRNVIDALPDKDKLAVVGARGGTVNMWTGRARITDTLRSSWYVAPYIHGSFFAFPYQVCSAAAFPLEYFMYWEDVVWSWRVRQKGVQLLVGSDIGVEHEDSEARESEAGTYYTVRNGAYTLRHTQGVWRYYWAFVNLLREVYHRVVSRKKIVARALSDARRNRMGEVEL